ncbi:MAG: hypothetical protein ACYTEQ_01645 [Planctomycetota bacterium]|jgi:hypothetical protein
MSIQGAVRRAHRLSRKTRREMFVFTDGILFTVGPEEDADRTDGVAVYSTKDGNL